MKVELIILIWDMETSWSVDIHGSILRCGFRMQPRLDLQNLTSKTKNFGFQTLNANEKREFWDTENNGAKFVWDLWGLPTTFSPQKKYGQNPEGWREQLLQIFGSKREQVWTFGKTHWTRKVHENPASCWDVGWLHLNQRMASFLGPKLQTKIARWISCKPGLFQSCPYHPSVLYNIYPFGLISMANGR